MTRTTSSIRSYSIDFAFLRAYEDGKPADTTKHYFKWKSGGAKKDELVFVSGNPGVTNRLFTKAQLEFERDIKIPIIIELLTNKLRIWKEPPFDPENPSRHHAWIRTEILGLENGLKAARTRPCRLPAIVRSRRNRGASQSSHEEVGKLGGDDNTTQLSWDSLFVDHLVRARSWLPKDDPFLHEGARWQERRGILGRGGAPGDHGARRAGSGTRNNVTLSSSRVKTRSRTARIR